MFLIGISSHYYKIVHTCVKDNGEATFILPLFDLLSILVYADDAHNYHEGHSWIICYLDLGTRVEKHGSKYLTWLSYENLP